MFRLWGKIIKNNDIISDYVFESNLSELSLQEKINKGIEAFCYEFDITRPMWFKDNDKDIEMVGKTRFIDHHFIESISFDALEIDIIENKDY